MLPDVDTMHDLPVKRLNMYYLVSYNLVAIEKSKKCEICWFKKLFNSIKLTILISSTIISIQ